jgi:Glycosyltransferase
MEQKINYATVPQDRDKIVCVSEYVKQTWDDKTKDALVINNVMGFDKPKNAPLLLVTASRLDAPDKGAKRMVQLAKLMESQGISYIWLCFANKGISGSVPMGMIFMQPTLDIIKWVQKADYLVQLSDEEAFCYSLVEALEVNTPVIVTELDIWMKSV